MYDSILMKISCPCCNKTSEIDFQTKSGPRNLHYYKLGEKFEFNEEALKSEKALLKHHSKPKYLFFFLGSCRKCEVQISGCAWINTKTFIIEEVELHSYTVKIKPQKSYKIGCGIGAT